MYTVCLCFVFATFVILWLLCLVVCVEDVIGFLVVFWVLCWWEVLVLVISLETLVYGCRCGLDLW